MHQRIKSAKEIMSKAQCIAQDSTIKSTKQRTIIMDKIENSFPTRIENILFNVECLVLKGGGKCRRPRLQRKDVASKIFNDNTACFS